MTDGGGIHVAKNIVIFSRRDNIQTYYKGMIEGVRRFAIWQDGGQYVGDRGWPLDKAIAYLKAEESQKLSSCLEDDVPYVASRDRQFPF